MVIIRNGDEAIRNNDWEWKVLAQGSFKIIFYGLYY